MSSPASRIAVTLGDPAGVGPEVALRALGEVPRLRSAAVLLGDLEATRETIDRLKLPVRLRPVKEEDLGVARRPRDGAVPILAPREVRPLRTNERRPGRPTRAGARTAFAALTTAIDLARDGRFSALCTAPISKEWFARAGVARTGHTEILAERTGSKRVRLMMALDDLRIVLATSHLALRDVPDALTVSGVAESIAVTAEHLQRWFGLAQPRIAVAALNPHAGDGGVYGTEERTAIRPAIVRVRRRGLDVVGPVPGDTLFSSLGPRADAIVAMYHDQGLIPIKQRDVHGAVNVTLGIPFIRTSPDHGTAFELAPEGRARPDSMVAALRLAHRLARIHKKSQERSQ